ncbi:uncharacterized protein VTP21DRAFT_5731 [Calcarisporiella thermophila]|uniref:uncharacterized protein n=1 Tax=Calcarisporiella thermophila TaxID=911321 RepID=UPI0037425FC8
MEVRESEEGVTIFFFFFFVIDMISKHFISLQFEVPPPFFLFLLWYLFSCPFPHARLFLFLGIFRIFFYFFLGYFLLHWDYIIFFFFPSLPLLY